MGIASGSPNSSYAADRVSEAEYLINIGQSDGMMYQGVSVHTNDNRNDPHNLPKSYTQADKTISQPCFGTSDVASVHSPGQKSQFSEIEHLDIPSPQDRSRYDTIGAGDKPRSENYSNIQSRSKDMDLASVLGYAQKPQVTFEEGSSPSWQDLAQVPRATREYDYSNIDMGTSLFSTERLMVHAQYPPDGHKLDRFRDGKGEIDGQNHQQETPNSGSHQMLGGPLIKETNHRHLGRDSFATSGGLGKQQADKLFSKPRHKNTPNRPNSGEARGDERWSKHSALNAFSDLNPIKKGSTPGKNTSRSPASLHSSDEYASRRNIWKDRQSFGHSQAAGQNPRQESFSQSHGRQSVDILTESELGAQRVDQARDAELISSGVHPGSAAQHSSANGTGESKKQSSRVAAHQSNRNKGQGPKGSRKQRSREHGSKNELKGG